MTRERAEIGGERLTDVTYRYHDDEIGRILGRVFEGNEQVSSSVALAVLTRDLGEVIDTLISDRAIKLLARPHDNGEGVVTHWSCAMICGGRLYYQNSLAGYDAPAPIIAASDQLGIARHNIGVTQQNSTDNHVCGPLIVENLIAMAHIALTDDVGRDLSERIRGIVRRISAIDNPGLSAQLRIEHQQILDGGDPIQRATDALDAYNAAIDARTPGSAVPVLARSEFAPLAQLLISSPTTTEQTVAALAQTPERDRELALSALMMCVAENRTTDHVGKSDALVRILASSIPQNGSLSARTSCFETIKDICKALAISATAYVAASSGHRALTASEGDKDRSASTFAFCACVLVLIVGIPQVLRSCGNVFRDMRNKKEAMRIASEIGRCAAAISEDSLVTSSALLVEAFTSAGLSRSAAKTAILSKLQHGARTRVTRELSDEPSSRVQRSM